MAAICLQCVIFQQEGGAELYRITKCVLRSVDNLAAVFTVYRMPTWRIMVCRMEVKQICSFGSVFVKF